ncbi:MAG: hypothetical protein K9N06_03445 [Candidatus Cloacimonetes bacterium]|nr:hypothetical protein [Candidatus Cloacimonadota bacterium]
MKKSLIISLLLLISISLMGRWVVTNQSQNPELFECEQQHSSVATIEFALDGFELEEKVYEGEKYTVISHDEAGELLDIGMPDVPVFTKALIIPDQGTADVEILSYDVQEFENVIIYPQEELQLESEPLRNNFTINNAFYRGSSGYPAEIAWAGEPAIMRDFRVVPVTFCPFQYDPASRTLLVYSNIRIRVTVSGSGGINTKVTSHKRSRAFAPLYKANTLNYDLLTMRDEYQVPTILFICNNNTSVLSNLEYLTEWKKQKGFNVVVATTSETGTSNIAIKNYIQNAYDNWENPPEYVNIMGDGSGAYLIPTWYSSGTYGEGDHPYSQLEGNDVLGDVIMGRMTFSNITALQTVISKVFAYEKTPYMGNTDWYSRALLTGDPTHSGYSTITVSKAAKELMLDYPDNFWDDDNFVEVYTSPFSTQMNSAINLGVSYYGYRGYLGMSGWSYGSTSNGYMMPFANIPTCGSNNWNNGTGIAEGFYLMGTSSLPNGGIGAMGTATSGTHTPFNNAIALGVWGGIFRDDIYSMGGAVLQGKYYLWLTFPQNPSNYVNTFSHWNTLMGDASVELWTGIPQHMDLEFNPIIPVGADHSEVIVHDANGNTITDAWVTLYKDDGTFTATTFTDNSGTAQLDLNDAPEGGYTLTVTGHNFIPSIEIVSVERVPQFVTIQSVSYDDAAGNGNGIVNPGESVQLLVTLENTGSSDVSGINASLQVSSDYVTVITPEAGFGNIGSGATAIAGYEVQFAAALQGGVDVNAILNITDNDDNEWISYLQIPIEGPSLYASLYTVYGDGIIDPGETVEMNFTLHNNGNLLAADIEGVLLCNNHRITIEDSLGSFNTIYPGMDGNNANDRFTITASAAIIPGTYIPFIIHLTNADGYNGYVTMNVPIGVPSVSDPYGPDEYGYWCYDDGDTDYDKCPVYDWIEIDHDYGGDGTSIIWAGGTATGNGGGTGNYANIAFPDDFTFKLYGEEYDQMCVCTNGWIAPGYHETANFMNYQIPGPQGPSPMIAVFWDDMNISSGDVLWYYDEEHHYLVVEWSRILNGDTYSPETYQVIFYDPVYYPTTTGDSEIKMQYMDITNNNAGSYPSNHGQYCTIGLENEDSLIGLQYTFNNTYPSSCKVLEDQMAILFTPPPMPVDAPFLIVSSYYPYAGDDNYIEAGEAADLTLDLENMGEESAHNVSVEISINDPYITVTDNYATCPDIPAGETVTLENGLSIEVSENVPDFYTFYIEASISCDEDSWNCLLPFTAYWPNTFSVDPDSIYYYLETQQSGTQQFTLTNVGNLPVNFYVRIEENVTPERAVTGSNITLNTDTFTPGEETTWSFTVANNSPDNEWLTDVWINFPPGVTVLDAGDVIGGSGGNLIWDGTTGAGQSVNWHGTTANGWGVIHDGEEAHWDVNVQLSTQFAGDLILGWDIGGDGYGAGPHIVSGEISLLYPLRWISLDISIGSLIAGGSQVFTINFDTSEIEAGTHQAFIVISGDSWDQKTIPVTLYVNDDTGSYGDVDDNGSVEAFDAALVLQYFVGFNPPGAPLPWDLWRQIRADVDGNQNIEAFDSSLIMQYAVGLITIFPVEVPQRLENNRIDARKERIPKVSK